MACLADESRFRIVLALSATEQCVSDLARRVGLSQSCTTRHLQALSRRGLVNGSRRGRQVVYALVVGAPEIRILLGVFEPEGSVSPAEAFVDEMPAVAYRELTAPQADPGLDLSHPPASDIPEPESSSRGRPPINDIEDYLL